MYLHLIIHFSIVHFSQPLNSLFAKDEVDSVQCLFWWAVTLKALPRDHCILGQAFNTLSPRFWCVWQDRVFFIHYTNDTTLTLLRNSLFNKNKNNILFNCYIKHLKLEDEVMKKVSPIIQCSIHYQCKLTLRDFPMKIHSFAIFIPSVFSPVVNLLSNYSTILMSGLRWNSASANLVNLLIY